MSFVEEEETEIRNIVDKESVMPVRCERQCWRQGDRASYNSEKEIIAKILSEDSAAETSQSEDTDSIRTGESVFKTFHFNAEDDDPEMEKCMNFWNSILTKNVKPMKCTLARLQKMKEKGAKREKVEKADVCEKEETKRLWLDVYKELQKRRLHEVKLVKTRTREDIDCYDEEYEKKQEFDEIKKLNEWKSHHHPSKLDIKAQVKRTLQVLRATRAGTSSEEKLSGTADSKSKRRSESTVPVIKVKANSSTESNIVAKDRKQRSFSRKSTESKSQKLSTSEVQLSTTQQHVEPSVQKSTVTLNSASKEPIAEAVEKSTSDQAQVHIHKSRDVVKEEPESEKEEELIGRKAPDICCKCGCEIDQCICEDMEDLGIEVETENFQTCTPCDCQSTCLCEEDTQDKNVCSCGCSVEECVCQKDDTCRCECGLEECICETSNVCVCGCGLEDCICRQLFTRMCECGHEDCDCDTVEILSTYLGTLSTPTQSGFVSTGSQTDGRRGRREEAQKQGRYCVICGHFDCKCDSDSCE